MRKGILGTGSTLGSLEEKARCGRESVVGGLPERRLQNKSQRTCVLCGDIYTSFFLGRENGFPRRTGSAIFMRNGKPYNCSGEAVLRDRETGLKEIVLGQARINEG